MFEFVSEPHLDCPRELLGKARGESLFRDENLAVRRAGRAEDRLFCSCGGHSHWWAAWWGRGCPGRKEVGEPCCPGAWMSSGLEAWPMPALISRIFLDPSWTCWVICCLWLPFCS